MLLIKCLFFSALALSVLSCARTCLHLTYFLSRYSQWYLLNTVRFGITTKIATWAAEQSQHNWMWQISSAVLHWLILQHVPWSRMCWSENKKNKYFRTKYIEYYSPAFMKCDTKKISACWIWAEYKPDSHICSVRKLGHCKLSNSCWLIGELFVYR